MAQTHPTASSSKTDPVSEEILAEIQSALQTVMMEGTGHASDLKKFDKMLEMNAKRLREEPSNKVFQAEQASKQAIRDECREQIRLVSTRVAHDLYAVYRRLVSAQLPPPPEEESSASNTSAGHTIVPQLSPAAAPAPTQDPFDHQREQQNLAAHVKILQKQLAKNEEEMDRICGQHRQIIESLQQQLAAHDAELRRLEGLVVQSSACVAPSGHERTQSEDAMAVDSRRDMKEESLGVGAREGDGDGEHNGWVKMIVREQRTALDQMSTEVTDLRGQVVAYLAEIPEHLKRAVRMIQEDVQATLQSTAASHRKHLSDLLHLILQDFEARLAALEARATRSNLPLANPSNNDNQNQLQHSQIPSAPSDQPLASPSKPPSKDPRILRRQSALSSSSDCKPTILNDPANCQQQ